MNSHRATADTEEKRKRDCRESLFSLSAPWLCGSVANSLHTVENRHNEPHFSSPFTNSTAIGSPMNADFALVEDRNDSGDLMNCRCQNLRKPKGFRRAAP